ncbi:MAG TPA: UrcA family protein [Steroidobacteraceae bacterium]
MYSMRDSFRTSLSALALAASVLQLTSMTVRADETKQIDITGDSPLVITSGVSFLPISVNHVTVLNGGFNVIDRAKLSSRVNIADLNLSTHAGVTELKWRVLDAAQAVCKELATRYPDGTPSEAQCAKTAAKDALATVRKIVAAAAKRAPIDQFASTN